MMLPPQQEDPPQSLEALLSSLNDVATTETRSELMVQDSIKNGSIKISNVVSIYQLMISTTVTKIINN
jgi:hypothetical protein